ncbi:MAG: hypothetical protein E7345_05305 [Clostridiales bacterium]|nr:hypothetical protein [Clostridiales bacterium]
MKWKELWEKLKSPKGWFAIVFSIIATVVIALTLVLVSLGKTNSILAYVLYGFSAVLLTYLVYIVVYFSPRFKDAIIRLLKKNKVTNEMLESYGYRSIIFAIFSFVFNIAFAIFQSIIAILSRSIWFGALATYYIALSLIRGGVVVISRKHNNLPDKEKQIRSYRNCGIYLVLLNFALMGAIVQMCIEGGGYKYSGLLIYVMATYTFYKLSMSIYHLFRARKHNDYTIQSIRNISFADAMVSILGLQTALLTEFSEAESHVLPNSLVGGAVSILIIGVGTYMIYKGKKDLKNFKQSSREEK